MRPKKIEIISQQSPAGMPRAILLFLGWGMDCTPFRHLAKPGYDIIAVYDYAQGMSQDDGMLERYSEIVVVAWSFGVRAAGDFLRTTKLPVTRTIAVNGTETHIHDRYGIPERIFQGTLHGLSERNIEKFRRRMCGSAEAFRQFSAVAPRRSFDSLKEELETFATEEPVTNHAHWSCAVIGGRDMIFPAEAQRAAWHDIPVTVYPDMPHLADLQAVIDRFVVDKELVAERFSNVADTYTANAGVQAECARKLWQLTSPHIRPDRKLGLVTEIGAGCGELTRQYAPALDYTRLEIRDIARLDPATLPQDACIIQGDAEASMASEGEADIDLMLSSSTIQWFNSPETFIRNAAAKLSDGGIMALSYFTEGTCREIADATGVTLSYPSHRRLLDAARESGLEIITEDTDDVSAHFASPIEALRHLQRTGVNALRRNGSASKAARQLLDNFPRLADGSCSLSYSTAYIIAKKSQKDSLQIS